MKFVSGRWGCWASWQKMHSRWWAWHERYRLWWGIQLNEGGVPCFLMTKNIIYLRTFSWRIFLLTWSWCKGCPHIEYVPGEDDSDM